MQKGKIRHRHLALLLAFLLPIGVYWLGYVLWLGEGSKGSYIPVAQAKHYRVLLAGAEKLQQRYERGDTEQLIARGLLSCPDIPASPLITGEYLQCNPHYLNCFLGTRDSKLQNRFAVDLEGQKHWVEARPFGPGQRYYRIVSKGVMPGTRVPHYAVQLELTLSGEKGSGSSLFVLLEDTCRDVYLPQRVYAYREHSQPGAVEVIWNNLNREIYIDKRLVTFRDLVDWLEVEPHVGIQVPEDRAQWALPASGLTVVQMERYCQLLGKQVATTLVYDAASFFPLNRDQPTTIDRQFPPFPWSRRAFGHPLLAMQAGESPFDQSICSDLWVRECEEQGFGVQSFPGKRTSWIGMRDILGGYPEYLRNPISPPYNLKVSSFYLSLRGEQGAWHRLGRRGSWTGRGFTPSAFSFEGAPLFPRRDRAVAVGFRCMLEGPGEG